MLEKIKGILAASSMLRRLVMVNGFVLLLVVTPAAALLHAASEDGCRLQARGHSCEGGECRGLGCRGAGRVPDGERDSVSCKRLQLVKGHLSHAHARGLKHNHGRLRVGGADNEVIHNLCCVWLARCLPSNACCLRCDVRNSGWHDEARGSGWRLERNNGTAAAAGVAVRTQNAVVCGVGREVAEKSSAWCVFRCVHAGKRDVAKAGWVHGVRGCSCCCCCC